MKLHIDDTSDKSYRARCMMLIKNITAKARMLLSCKIDELCSVRYEVET